MFRLVLVSVFVCKGIITIPTKKCKSKLPSLAGELEDLRLAIPDQFLQWAALAEGYEAGSN